MAQTLTNRQAQILKAIIEEYTSTAEAVGSITLEKKYDLGVSPATIRNEMIALTKAGFLIQPHTSAGRVPTPLALKYYVRELIKEEDMSVAEEVAVKEKVWDHRLDIDKFLRELTRALAEKTNALAITCTKDGRLYHAGYTHILSSPEFYDIDVARQVLAIIDEFNQIHAIFEQAQGDDPIHILVGDDVNHDFFSSLSLVFTDFAIKDKIAGSLGIIGPSRLSYPTVIPTIRYFGELISDIAQNW